MPILVVARHAHTEKDADSDFDRRLTPEGEAEAARAGQFLSDLPLDYLVASSAVRTQQTGEAVAQAQREAGHDVELHSDEALYQGTVEDWLEAISAIPESARGAYIVGHMPTVAAVVTALCGAEPESFKPSTIAVFELPEWNVTPGDYPQPQIRNFC